MPPIAAAANLLTVVSMAALGFGTDLMPVAMAGGRVTVAVMLSLVVWGAMGVALIRALGIA